MKCIDFTERAKPWLNAFTFDLAQTPEKVIDRIKDFPGNQEMVSVALKQGLEVIDPKDPAVAKELGYMFYTRYQTDFFNDGLRWTIFNNFS